MGPWGAGGCGSGSSRRRFPARGTLGWGGGGVGTRRAEWLLQSSDCTRAQSHPVPLTSQGPFSHLALPDGQLAGVMWACGTFLLCLGGSPRPCGPGDKSVRGQ